MKKTKKIFRVLSILIAFGLSFVGFSYSNRTEKIAGVDVTVRSLSLTQAMAFSEGINQPGWGMCNSFGRCAYFFVQGNCMP